MGERWHGRCALQANEAGSWEVSEYKGITYVLKTINILCYKKKKKHNKK